jgi:hypothetical protein
MILFIVIVVFLIVTVVSLTPPKPDWDDENDRERW